MLKLIRHPDQRLISSPEETAQSPGFIHLPTKARYEEIRLREPDNQTRSDIIIHDPAELRAIVVDRVNDDKRERQQRTLHINSARREGADDFPIAHFIGW